MYRLFNSLPRRRSWHPIDEGDEASIFPTRRKYQGSTIPESTNVDNEEPLKASIDLMLKRHQMNRLLSPKPKVSCETPPKFYRRDSYSTITTADETPLDENSTTLVITKSFDEGKNLISMEISFRKEQPPCRERSYSPQAMQKLQKSKKFLPDPMSVGDYYGDDIGEDEEIMFLPQQDDDKAGAKKDFDAIPQGPPAPPPPSGGSHEQLGCSVRADSKQNWKPKRKEKSGHDLERISRRPILHRGPSGGLDCIELPPRKTNNKQERSSPAGRRGAARKTCRVEI